MLVSGYR